MRLIATLAICTSLSLHCAANEESRANDTKAIPEKVAKILKSLEALKPGTKPTQFYKNIGIWDDDSVKDVGGGGSLGSYWDELDLGIDGEWLLMVEHAVDRTGEFKSAPTKPGEMPNTFVWEVRIMRGSIAAHDRGEEVDWKTIYPFYHKGKLIDEATDKKEQKTEQGGAGEPATRSESDSEGGDKPQPESEGRSR